MVDQSSGSLFPRHGCAPLQAGRGRWRPSWAGARAALPGLVLLLPLFLAPARAAAPTQWLSLCGQCLSPSLASSSGLGTDKATATARVRNEDAEAWCASYSPGDAGCVREQMASPEAKKTYRASADCTSGRLDAIDGHRYLQAGIWKNDVGRGRTRWRDAGGRVVGQDNASNGLALSQQWETLCPGQRAGVAEHARPSAAAVPSGMPQARFAAGERVEAKFGGRWVRGRVLQIRPAGSAQGPDAAYDVQLDNGRRGVLPASMIRKPGG